MAKKTIEELGLKQPVKDQIIEISADGWNSLNSELDNIAKNRYDFSQVANIDPSRFQFTANWASGETTIEEFATAQTSFIPKPYVLFEQSLKVNKNDIIYATIFNNTNNKVYLLNTNEIKKATRNSYQLPKETYEYSFDKQFNKSEDWTASILGGTYELNGETLNYYFPSYKQVYEEECKKYYETIIDQVKKDDLITENIFKTLYEYYGNSDYCFGTMIVKLTRIFNYNDENGAHQAEASYTISINDYDVNDNNKILIDYVYNVPYIKS